MKKPVIYQLVVRYFGNTNRTNKLAGTIDENGCGKFDDINDAAIQSLADLGVTHVWLTGVLRQATLTDHSSHDPRLAADEPDIVKGRAGSFYAVRDYVDVCPDYVSNEKNLATPEGRIGELRALIARLHEKGLKVLIDFVPNHTSRAYQSYMEECDFGAGDDRSKRFDPDNNFYYYPGQKLTVTVDPTWKQRVPGLEWSGTYSGEDGGPGRVLRLTGDLDVAGEDPAQPKSDRWYEGVKLNYGMDLTGTTGVHYDPVPRTWKMVDRIIRFWQEQGVDGFRCDMAYYVPDEFWRYVIGKARGRKDVYFVAEGYERQAGLIGAGFDAVYHFQAYNALVDIYRFGAPLERYSDELSGSGKDRRHMLNYIENHDEARVTTAVRPEGKSGFGTERANYQLAPLHFLAYDGPVMIYNGQEVGQKPDQSDAGFASAADGRTTFFDYWCMPELADWVNEHAYDGGLLGAEQKRLRTFFRDLLELCQDVAVVAPNHWGLRYCNNGAAFLSYARYQYKAERVLLVVANFRYQASETGIIRLPAELTRDIGWRYGDALGVNLLLDQNGKPAGGRKPLGHTDRASLEKGGITMTIPQQDCWVIEIVKA